ncbi:MAG: nucleotide exchange factor GrpE [Gammaproteobacteria bacterium]|nr:nucleotide exchange factor GrpE [Gammaproteobacteria bacterium]NNL99726.1 nucleotide exchange factor GrpE [Gammaproteobacteria bacterium]
MRTQAVTEEAEQQHEEPAAAPDSEAPAGTTAAELEAASARIAELEEEVLRARAELDNAQKRARRDVEAAHKYGLEKFVNALLPVKDSMDMGTEAAASATDMDGVREGMALTLKMLDDTLARLDVTALDPVGEKFDPEFHQAMTMEASNEAPAGTVLRVMQRGYLLNDRLLRPAMVVVAKAAE